MQTTTRRKIEPRKNDEISEETLKLVRMEEKNILQRLSKIDYSFLKRP